MNRVAILLLSMTSFLAAADDVVGVIHGTVEKIDSASKVIAVKNDGAAKFSVRIVESTTIHGFHGGKAARQGLEKGTEIVAHGTRNGVEFTATELDHLGKGGLKMTKATVIEIDRAGRFIVVKTAAGATETYHFASHSAHDVAKGMEGGTKVIVYCTEETGQKIGHFFVRLA